MSSRLGILGGMFDPVHNGHVAAARYAVETLGLDQLKMVPCHIPNHREHLQLSAEHRLAMLDLALSRETDISVDDCEIRRGGVSYAVDTVAELRTAGDWEHVVFVMGVDALNGLPRWHNWQELLRLCHLLVLSRQDQAVAAIVADQISLEQRQVSKPEELFAKPAGQILISEDFNVELSSTQVRELLAKGGEVAPFIDEDVHDYIRRNTLYTDTL